MSLNQHWHDPVADSYVATIAHKVPGYHLLHELTVDLLEAELKRPAPRILTVGAGGGEEIMNLLHRTKDWHVTGVDPSKPMLDMAKHRVAQLHMQERVAWHELTLEKVKDEAVYDAAVSLLVFHFVQERERVPFLQEIARRIKPGAPFVMASILGDMDSKAFQQELHMLSLFMERKGLGNEVFTSFKERLGDTTHLVSEEDVRGHLTQVGFENIRPYFQAGMIKGFICERGGREAEE